MLKCRGVERIHFKILNISLNSFNRCFQLFDGSGYFPVNLRKPLIGPSPKVNRHSDFTKQSSISSGALRLFQGRHSPYCGDIRESPNFDKKGDAVDGTKVKQKEVI